MAITPPPERVMEPRTDQEVLRSSRQAGISPDVVPAARGAPLRPSPGPSRAQSPIGSAATACRRPRRIAPLRVRFAGRTSDGVRPCRSSRGGGEGMPAGIGCARARASTSPAPERPPLPARFDRRHPTRLPQPGHPAGRGGGGGGRRVGQRSSVARRPTGRAPRPRGPSDDGRIREPQTLREQLTNI